MSRRSIPAVLQETVRLNAKLLCEYCHASEKWQYVRFTIDHVIPVAHRRKWNRQTANDPETNQSVLLFNPRRDVWAQHFIWSSDGTRIIGLTPTGRATIVALALNRERVIDIRKADRQIGRHPPSDDPILENC